MKKRDVATLLRPENKQAIIYKPEEEAEKL
jgi:hypothetical protein